MNLNKIDYVELYVANIVHALHFYCTQLGFKVVAYAGLETGFQDKISYILRQGSIFIVLTSALDTDSSIAKHIHQHGDGVKDIAIATDNASRLFDLAIKRGAEPIQAPMFIKNEHCQIVRAAVKAFGDTIHSFIERQHGDHFSLPDYQYINENVISAPINLLEIDHFAVCVEANFLSKWVDFYKTIFDFYESHEENVNTNTSGMNSKVVQSAKGNIKITITEPVMGPKKSQIQEFLSYYNGPGVQHIAFSTNNIISSVRALRANGIKFLNIPDTYYDIKKEIFNEIGEDFEALKELQILVDRDEYGYLMQTFSKPIQSRPTLFMEVIQRKGAEGFGGNNIKALFQAIEQEQNKRGTW